MNQTKPTPYACKQNEVGHYFGISERTAYDLCAEFKRRKEFEPYWTKIGNRTVLYNLEGFWKFLLAKNGEYLKR